MEIYKDIFAIPTGKKKYLLYAPLAEEMCLCDEEDLSSVQNILHDKTSRDENVNSICESLKKRNVLPNPNYSRPEEYSKLTILPNFICNLKCSYCYSAKGRSNTVISLDHMKAALLFLINNPLAKDNKRGIFISGGGEPMISWDTIKQGLDIAYEAAKEKGIILDVHMMSNGTLFRDETAKYLKEHGVTICISYEVLDDLQNGQRGKKDIVKRNINKYLNMGVELYISSTITPKSVNRLSEMIEELHQDFVSIKQITMEPVTEPTLFANKEEISIFYNAFDEEFTKAQTLAHKYGLSLYSSIIGISTTLVNRYCPGKLCLTPLGTFTICHCASSPKEERYEKCCYGKIDDEGKIIFNYEKFNQLIQMNHNNYPECKHCFAKYNCGGECMTRRDTYPQEFMEVVCNHTKKNLLLQLMKNFTIYD